MSLNLSFDFVSFSLILLSFNESKMSSKTVNEDNNLFIFFTSLLPFSSFFISLLVSFFNEITLSLIQ